MKSLFYTAIENVFSKHDFPIEPCQISLFEDFYDLLVEKNKTMNLTRITEPEEAAQKHFFDSVSLFKYIDLCLNASLIDIGTGAGFPGLPLKIMRPDLNLTLIDSSEKKIKFVKEAALLLKLPVEAYAARAEELCLDKPFREGFEFAVSRAVAPLPMLLELSTPFIKKNGTFVAYKGKDYETELKASQNALIKLNVKVSDIFLPYTERLHALIVFNKLKPTPKGFPRKFSAVKKNPL